MNVTSTWLTVALLALVACDGGFKEVNDAGQDAAGDLDAAGGLDLASGSDATAGDTLQGDAGSVCSKLVPTAGPIVLGYGDAESQFSALAATATHLASVWEQYYPSTSGAGSTQFAVQDLSGKVVVKALELDQSEYPPLPAMVAINDGFGLVQVHKEQVQDLQYLLVDAQGGVLKQTQLATGLGQYAAESTIAAGKAGIAVGYTMYDSAQKGQVYLGKIDENGTSASGFFHFTETGKERRYIKLLATDEGFVAVWSESRPNDTWAVVAAWMDGSLNPVSPPGIVVVAEDDRIHRRPAVARRGDDLLVCHESLVSGQDAEIGCRLVRSDGTLGDGTVSYVAGLSSRRPQVVAFGGGFAVLWTGVTTGLEEVHARVIAADGKPAGESQRLSEVGVRSWYPSVVQVGDALMAAWYRYVPITVYYASFRLSCEDG